MNNFVISTPAPSCSPSSTAPPFEAFTAFLEANPGHWAIYHTYPTSQSGRQRVTRARRTWGKRGFVFVSRVTHDGVAVYGVFMGPKTH
jgi:hypothetical protein